MKKIKASEEPLTPFSSPVNSPHLTDDQKKDIRLILLEANNIALQTQMLQNRNNQLGGLLVDLRAKAFADLSLSLDEFDIDFNTLEIIKKAV